MYVLSSIWEKPPKAVTIPSSIWKVAAVLLLKRFVRLLGSLGFPPIMPGIPPIMPPPYMPPPYPPYPPIMPPPYMLPPPKREYGLEYGDE